MDPKVMAGKIKSLISEYWMANDLKEVVMCIDELKSPTELWQVVRGALALGVQSKPEYRVKNAQLMVKLIGEQTLSVSDLERGIKEYCCTELEEEAEELPVAAERVAEMIAEWVVGGDLSLGFLKKYDGFAKLADSGQAEKLVGNLLKFLLAKKDAAYVKAAWTKEDLSLSPFARKNTAALVEKYGLEAVDVN